MKKKLLFLHAIIVLLSGCSTKIGLSLKSVFQKKKNELQQEEWAVSTKTHKPEPQKDEIIRSKQPCSGEVKIAKKRLVSSIAVTAEDSPNEKGGTVAYLPSRSNNKIKNEWGREKFSSSKLYVKAFELKKFAEKSGYNTKIALLIDMEVKSGRKRFFVYDLENMKILNSGLVAHGSGGTSFSYDKFFSNSPGSSCTSLGKYKIGNSYQGSFGLAYKLYGLEGSNSNAFKRYVVLHSMGCIQDNETNKPLCQSEGCPAVSPSFLEYLQLIIDNSKKPILLWIYE
jgi:hypothetical protein